MVHVAVGNGSPKFDATPLDVFRLPMKRPAASIRTEGSTDHHHRADSGRQHNRRTVFLTDDVRLFDGVASQQRESRRWFTSFRSSVNVKDSLGVDYECMLDEDNEEGNDKADRGIEAHRSRARMVDSVLEDIAEDQDVLEAQVTAVDDLALVERVTQELFRSGGATDGCVREESPIQPRTVDGSGMEEQARLELCLAAFFRNVTLRRRPRGDHGGSTGRRRWRETSDVVDGFRPVGAVYFGRYDRESTRFAIDRRHREVVMTMVNGDPCWTVDSVLRWQAGIGPENRRPDGLPALPASQQLSASAKRQRTFYQTVVSFKCPDGVATGAHAAAKEEAATAFMNEWIVRVEGCIAFVTIMSNAVCPFTLPVAAVIRPGDDATAARSPYTPCFRR